MPEANTDHRSSPYSSLRACTENEADKVRGASVSSSPTSTPPTEPDYLTQEADRLESFKQALFAAFLAAPKAGIPTALVDLAATYTSALRLQMSLKGFSASHTRGPKAPTIGAAKR